MYAGGAYEIKFPEISLAYCKGAYTGDGELFSYLNGEANPWNNNGAPLDNSGGYVNCWTDNKVHYISANYLPASWAAYIGTA